MRGSSRTTPPGSSNSSKGLQSWAEVSKHLSQNPRAGFGGDDAAGGAGAIVRCVAAAAWAAEGGMGRAPGTSAGCFWAGALYAARCFSQL